MPPVEFPIPAEEQERSMEQRVNVSDRLAPRFRPGSAELWLVFAGLLALGLIVVFVVAWYAPAAFTKHDRPHRAQISGLDLLKERNAVRATLLQGLAGVFLLASAVVAWLQLTSNARQVREGQEAMTKQLALARSSARGEHMSKAVTALGDPSVDVRVGGVFALEQAMDELAPIDGTHAELGGARTFREDGLYVLASFVRTRSRLENPTERLPRNPPHSGGRPGEADEDEDMRVRLPDAQAACLVLGRRQEFSDADFERIAELQGLDEDDPAFDPKLKSWLKRVEVSLHKSYLNNAALSDLNLSLVRFDEAVLAFASLRRSNLRCSRLVRADLRRAFLRGADLRWTNLEGADLTRARAIDADFSGASLRRANFADSTIRGARFDLALGVDEVRTWARAKADSRTRWPATGIPHGVVIADE
jgi:hypothetical protein